jgi:ferredoxin
MVKRKATVNMEKCVACGVCALQCPRQAISVYKGCYAVVADRLCVGCGLCEKSCPANVIELKERDAVNG